MAPGFVTSGLELWQGEECAQSYFRQRLWGTLSMAQTLLADRACWMRHMKLDPATGELNMLQLEYWAWYLVAEKLELQLQTVLCSRCIVAQLAAKRLLLQEWAPGAVVLLLLQVLILPGSSCVPPRPSRQLTTLFQGTGYSARWLSLWRTLVMTITTW